MTVTVRNQTPLVVPPSVRRKAGFRNGQKVEFEASNGVITIVPKPSKDHVDCTPEQRRVINARLAEGLADLDAGRVRGPFATHKEFIESLHAEARKLKRRRSARSAR